MRHHHLDPQHRQDVMTDASWSEMRWDRWTSWKTGDPRWTAETINTSDLDPREAVEALQSWITGQRRRSAQAR